MEIGAKTLSTEENHQTTSNGQIGGKTCSYPRNPYLKYLPFYTLVECFVRVCYFNFLFFFFFYCSPKVGNSYENVFSLFL